MAVALVIGGQASTRNQLGLALFTVAQHPRQWAVLADHPELAERATEEVIRFSPAVPIILRVATERILYRDLDIATGTRV